MYSTDNNYPVAIKSRIRNDSISGSVSLAAGGTIEIDDSVLVSGTLRLSKELCGKKYRIGTFNVSCLRFSFFTDDALSIDLTGATVQLSYTITDENNAASTVPLGIYFVDPIQSSRQKDIISVVAYDAGVKADKEPSAGLRAMSCTPAELIIATSEECGIDTDIDTGSLDELPNSGITVSASGRQIQTCRDIIMWCAALLCGYAVIDRDSKLAVIPAKYSASGSSINASRTVTSEDRKSITVTDTRSYIKYLTAYRNDEPVSYTSDYTSEDEQAAPASYVLEKNPLLAGKTDSECDTANRAWLAYIDAFKQRDIHAVIYGDPALDTGDTLRFSGGDVDQRGSVVGLVTSYVWNYRGVHEVFCSAAECAGSLVSSGSAAYTRTQTSKRIDAIETGGSGGVGENVGKHNERFNSYDGANRNQIIDSTPDTPGTHDYNRASGCKNTITDSSYCDAGGYQNSMTGSNYCEVGGNQNSATYSYCDRVGGYKNTVTGPGPYQGSAYNDVGGQENTLTTVMRSAARGFKNILKDTSNSIVTGNQNNAENLVNSLLGGYKNNVTLGGNNNGGIVGVGYENECVGMGSMSMFCGESNFIAANSTITCGRGNDNRNAHSVLCGMFGKTTGGNELFAVGNGSSGNLRNIFFVLGTGNVYAAGSYNTMSADYAEMFEWTDGNPDNEYRVGLLVSLDGDKIRPADGDDILGVISVTASVIGNDPYEWHGKYVKDVYGKIITSPNGEPLISPDYDPAREYIPRSQRPEWTAVGLVGRLVVRDDGTCVPGGFVTARNGEAAASLHETRIRALRRVDETHVEVLIK